MSNAVTSVARKTKPKKPSKDFPLYAHNNGSWAKTVRQKKHYFGTWEDPQAALKEWLEVRDYLLAGETPPQWQDPVDEGPIVDDLLNAFISDCRRKERAGEMTARTVEDYKRAATFIANFFGKGAALESINKETLPDFREFLSVARTPHKDQPAKSDWTQCDGGKFKCRECGSTDAKQKTHNGVAVATLKDRVNKCRVIFTFAYDTDLIEKPIKVKKAFAKPSVNSMRRGRAQQQRDVGKKMFSADEIRLLLDGSDEVKPASCQMRAMILLGINCGMGPTDIGALPVALIDDSGWLNYARIKTGIDRRIPLWPETRAALSDVIAKRPKAKYAADGRLVFITKYGHAWVRTGPSGKSNLDNVGKEFAKLLRAHGMKRHGVGFYALRHTFETRGGVDQVAIDALMGHIDDSMGAIYREENCDERLLAVVNTIHGWLFGGVE